VIISSPDNLNNYSDHPEMSVQKLTDVVIDKILHTETNFFVVNFANADMVGHTGNLLSTIAAVKAIDEQFKRLSDAVLSVDGCLIITADHGNAEEKIDIQTGAINKDHTTAPVPFIVISNELKRTKPIKFTYDDLASIMPEGALSDIAPTILEMFEMKKPIEMTGISLMPVIEASAGKTE
jgi:2,3-bisphosphoglycerate-independent phosphoglycerate mutase